MKHKITFFALLMLVLCLGFVGTPASAQIDFKPAVGIPGSEDFGPGETVTIQGDTFGKYVQSVYIFGIAVGVIVAAVVVMAGGFIWLTAGGNVGQIGQAKEYIGGAFAGMALLLLSWTILNTINPNLVKLKNLTSIDTIEHKALPCSSPSLIRLAHLVTKKEEARNEGFNLVSGSFTACGLTEAEASRARAEGEGCYCRQEIEVDETGEPVLSGNVCCFEPIGTPSTCLGVLNGQPQCLSIIEKPSSAGCGRVPNQTILEAGQSCEDAISSELPPAWKDLPSCAVCPTE